MGKKPKKGGRPRSLNDAAKATIIEIVGEGLSRNRAAVYVGVRTSTIANEAERDPKFLDALRKAEVGCERHHVNRIRVGEKTWQSSAWFLQRKWPKRYAERKTEDTPGSLMELARSLVAASPPRGTTPGVEQPGAVQDGSRGASIGQDGTDGQTPPGALAAGTGPAAPGVA